MRKIFIKPYEVAILLGCSEGYARRIVRRIKKSLGRTKNQHVTYKEFADDYGISIEEVMDGIKPCKLVK